MAEKRVGTAGNGGVSRSLASIRVYVYQRWVEARYRTGSRRRGNYAIMG
jgi:hypothetical protein